MVLCLQKQVTGNCSFWISPELHGRSTVLNIHQQQFKQTNKNSSFSHMLLCLWLCSGGGEGSLDRLLPPVSTGLSPRKRTTSQCKSEPPLLRTSKRTIYTAGRPPWYNEHGTQSKEAFVIGRTYKERVSHFLESSPLICHVIDQNTDV